MEGTKTHSDMRAELLGKAASDADFRALLVEDPKAAIKEALSLDLPDSVSVHVHEDAPLTAHLVLPPSSKLTEEDLEAIAAGHETTGDIYSDEPAFHLHPDTGEWHGSEI